MFWSFNKKVFWKDLWSSGFIDMHNHLLWGLDDGAKSFEETMLLCEMMQELGVTSAITTPHIYPGLWNNDIQGIEKVYANYKSQSNDTFIKDVSSEYLADIHLESLLATNSLKPLCKNYLLIEFSYLAPPNNLIMETLFKLKLKGYKLILAHPERYLYWKNSPSAFERFKEFEIHFQINTLSLLGHYGGDVKKLAEKLLEKEFYDFIGTDTHHKRHLAVTKNEPMLLPKSTVNILEALVEANNKTFRTKIPK